MNRRYPRNMKLLTHDLVQGIPPPSLPLTYPPTLPLNLP